VWKEISDSLKLSCIWEGPYLEQAWKLWLQDHRHIELKSLPPIIFWGIWLARNSLIFQEKTIAPQVTAAQSLSIFSHFSQNPTKSGPKSHTPEQIYFTKPWAYFDGASQNNICGGGFTLHLTSSHSFHTKLGLGQGTNNHAELLTLKLLLAFAKENDLRHIQIFGDSQIVVNWGKEN
jgi:hypothetical protein